MPAAGGIKCRSEGGDEDLGVPGKLKALNQLLKRLFFQGHVYTPLWSFHPGHSIRVKRTKLCCLYSCGAKTGTAPCTGMCAQDFLYHVCADGKTSPAYKVPGHGDKEPQQPPFEPDGMRELIWC